MARQRKKKELWCDSKNAIYLFCVLGVSFGLLTIHYHNKIGYTYFSFGICYLIWLSMTEIRYQYDTLGYFLHQCHQHCFSWFAFGFLSYYCISHFI